MIHLYTGEGKGKTTAAIGLCVRAAGRGFRVCFSQFMKGNDTGELYVMAEIPRVEILRSEKNYGFYSSMSENDKRELTAVHNRILDRLLEMAESGDCDMVVLDEVTYPVKWGLLDREKLKALLALGSGKGSGGLEMVLTGRDAEGFMIDAADYITEMQCVRHPYDKGIAARRGIEF